MSHLVRRATVYYYRARVPSDLRKLLGREVFSVSLFTHDFMLARERAHILAAGQLKLTRALRDHGLMLDSAQLDALVARYMTSFDANREDDSVAVGKLSTDEGRVRRLRVAENARSAEIALTENDLESVEILANELLREPDHAWKLILQIMQRSQDDSPVLDNLAAGPLESLLAEHGRTVVKWVEDEARRNPKFKELLAGVWQNGMSELIWQRVQRGPEMRASFAKTHRRLFPISSAIDSMEAMTFRRSPRSRSNLKLPERRTVVV